MKNSIITSQEEKETGLLSLECSLPWEMVSSYESEALKEVGKDVGIQGFRKGHVPDAVLKKSVGELKIAEEAARIAIRETYPKLLQEINRDLIGAPTISITKLAPGNPLEFRVEIFLAPTVTLGDYKKSAKEAFKSDDFAQMSVSEEEVENGITHIQTQFSRSEKWEKMRTEAEENNTPVPIYSDISVEPHEMVLLTDEFVQKIGNFKTVEEFKEKFRETLAEEKKLRAHDKKLGQALEEIINTSTFSIPNALIKSESLRLEHEFAHSLEHAGRTVEQYVAENNTTHDALHAQWENEAQRKIKTQLVLEKIASTEKITPEEDRIKEETEKILSHYKDAVPEGAESYARTVLTHRAVLDYLASLGKS